MKRIALAIFAALAATATARAQEAVGDWRGVLQVTADARLTLIVHIAAGADGRLQGTLDSVEQGASGLPLADIVRTGDRLSFTVPSVGGRYEGRWNAADKGWNGSWTQGQALPLNLTPRAPAPPRQPFPTSWTIPADPEVAALIDARIAGRRGGGMVVGIGEAGRAPRFVARGPVGGAAFNAATLFEIGSMTKVFTALLLADMVQRGEVKLDDAAALYLPEGAKMPERGRAITLRDLATHRSGLPRLPDNLAPSNPANPYADYDEARLLEFLGRYRLTRDVGSAYEYSNLGGGLLGYLLARRAGMSYEALLKRRILDPLGMRDTAISLTAGQKARFARGHDALMRPAPPWDLAVLAGAGALRSTAADIMLFLDAASGARWTSLAPAFALMLAERLGGQNAGLDTGLGWMVARSPRGEVILHDGGTGGFRTTMAYFPATRQSVVVLTNCAAEPSATDLALNLLIGAPLTPIP